MSAQERGQATHGAAVLANSPAEPTERFQLLHELPAGHDLRRLQLLGAQCRNLRSSVWRDIGKSWGIASATYDELGEAWTSTTEFRKAVNLPERVRLSRKKGWKMPPNTVSVARPGRWGNPHFVSRWRDARTCVALFEDTVKGIWNPTTSAHLPEAWNGYAEHVAWLRRMGASPLELLGELKGKNLACWCSLDQPCHAHVLIRLANQDAAEPTGRRG